MPWKALRNCDCHLYYFFVQITVLVWGAARWLKPRPPTPVEQLIERSRIETEQFVRALREGSGRLSRQLHSRRREAPLILAWQNIVSPLGVVLGPPLILLTSIALIFGFLLLMVSPIGAWIAWPFARVTELSLAGCEVLVHGGELIPGGWIYAPAPSTTWLIGFYLGVAGLVLLPSPWPKRFLIAIVVWTFVGLALSYRPRTTDELRVTFLAVGHGGCVGDGDP